MDSTEHAPGGGWGFRKGFGEEACVLSKSRTLLENTGEKKGMLVEGAAGDTLEVLRSSRSWDGGSDVYEVW